MTYALLATSPVYAFVGEHCLIKPDQIGPTAQKIFVVNKQDHQYFPNESVLQMDVESQISLQDGQFKNQSVLTFEGFFRPDESNMFSVLPIPLFVAQLERERHVVYVCAHKEEANPSQDYIIVYFLTGYRISRPTMSTFIGDMLFDSIDVKPISLVPIGTIPFRHLIENKLKGSPFVLLAVPVDLFTQLQNMVVHVLSFFTGIGVERITVTDQNINLASGINLKKPQTAVTSIDMPLKK